MDCFQILMVMIKLIEGLCTSLCVDRKVVYKSLCGRILSFFLSNILMGENACFLERLYHFAFHWQGVSGPVAEQFLRAFGSFLFSFSCLYWCIVVFHCVFNLQFPSRWH